MSERQWYYVEDGSRRGPVDEKDLIGMLRAQELDENSYVWTKGMENWQKVHQIEGLASIIEQDGPVAQEVDEQQENQSKTQGLATDSQEQNITKLADTQRQEGRWFLKVGSDRGSEEQQYGPFSLEMLIKLKEQNRINAMTLLYTRGMREWKPLGEFEDYQALFDEAPPELVAEDKRVYERKPFIARMFFANDDKLYEGICRDISLGGMQVLVAGFPGKQGDEIALNVHPENDQLHFVASGKIVRLLEEGQGFCFEFKELDDNAKNAINSFINE